MKKKPLENVNENEDLEWKNLENDEEYDSSESEENKEKEVNRTKQLTLKLSPCNNPLSEEQPIHEIDGKTKKIVENNTDVNEKHSLNSYSITERDSKFIGRKIFIPNLKNTTNSCNFF